MLEDIKHKMEELLRMDREHIEETSELRHEVRRIHDRIKHSNFPILARADGMPYAPKPGRKGPRP